MTGQPNAAQIRAFIGKQAGGDGGKDLRRAGKETAGIHGGAQRLAAVEGETAVGRTQAEQSAVARRRPNRAAGIGTEGKIAHFVRYR